MKTKTPNNTQRNSGMKLGEIYFWTATINQWEHLLKPTIFKEIIVGSLDNLSTKGLIDVYAFVIMPNHIHLIWRLNTMNGKETPKSSFLKFTAHQFQKTIREIDPDFLSSYKVEAINKAYEFWQRDPPAIILYTKEVMLQKLTYIHNNPLAAHWNLVIDPADYHYSSARFYVRGDSKFNFLKDIRLEF